MAANRILKSLDEIISSLDSSETCQLQPQQVVEEEEEVESKVPQLVSVPKTTGYRTHTCGELRMTNVGEKVSLTGWVQKCRDKNIAFMDLRDRYGITQCVFDPEKGDTELYETARKCGREWVVQVEGEVVERIAKNADRETGDIEVVATSIKVLNESKDPPFKIQDKTDGKEQLRMQYRYLDIRRNPIKEALILRNKVTTAVRAYLGAQDFVEIETPVLIKSTPEGARDFVVPSRMNPGQFYALPQSPQTFKQILMVAGMDRYFQIVKCFRDEELRADRQPEFTQIDCEMSFVDQKDVLSTFEAMIRHIFRHVVDHEFGDFPWMTFEEAMNVYGSDKPDLRFGMKLHEITEIVKGCGIPAVENAEIVVSIKLDQVCVKGGPYASKKKIKKQLEKLATSQLIGAGGMIWCKVDAKGYDSNAKKNMNQDMLKTWAESMNAEVGDLLISFAGPRLKTQDQMGKMRAELGNQFGLRGPEAGYSAHWVVDFPMFEWDEDEERWNAMHHPFTSPKPDDMQYLATEPGRVRANAYDMVINGVEVGGGSIRIHDRELQMQVFELLGFTQEAAQEQFGFLMNAFEYGAPPHGGLAFGLDRLCQILGMKAGLDYNSIRDYIAFPKNNQGRDTMINSPSQIDQRQLEELRIATTVEEPAQ